MLLTLALLALQEPQEPMPETIVTAPRAEKTLTHSATLVTVVTGEELARTGERSLPRALGKATGVWIQETNLGGGSPFIRGLTGNRILLIVDGVRVNDGTTRLGPNQSLNGFDPAIVDRIEVHRGPASVLYGSDAIGGVIVVWTKSRRPTGSGGGPELQDGLDYGLGFDYDSTVEGGSVTFDASQATADTGWLVIGTLYDFDDLETGGGTVPFTGYDGESIFGSYDLDLDEHRNLRITASIRTDFDVPRTDRLITGFGQTQPANEVFTFTLQERQRYVFAFTDRSSWGFSDELQMRLSYRRYIEHREKQKTGSTTFTDERDDTETLGLGLDFRKVAGGRHLLTYGLDLEHDEVDSARADTDLTTGGVTTMDGAFAPAARYVRSGIFLQDEISGELFDTTAGVRYSYYDFSFDGFGGTGREEGDFDALTASLQLGRNITENVRLTGTLAQGFRAPNLDDLANNGSFAGGEELANPDLDPEESVTVDLAVDAHGEGWNAGVAAFYTEIDDVIGRELIDPGDPTVDGDEIYMRQNVGEVEIYGVEAGGRVRLGDGSPYWAAASATLTRGRQFDKTLDPGDGATDARRIPPPFGRIALEVRLPTDHEASFWRLDWADVELLWADDQDHLNPQDRTDPRIDPAGTPGWAVLNVDVGGRLGGEGSRSSWRLGLHNVFDKEYRVHASGFDAPGRGLVVGIEWRP
ncbi:MAG: TonB-dependent receptor [Planctomycetota bacterium]|nr:TonB-dependent receptor [Planctomycetota bacterium]